MNAQSALRSHRACHTCPKMWLKKKGVFERTLSTWCSLWTAVPDNNTYPPSTVKGGLVLKFEVVQMLLQAFYFTALL